MKLSKKINCVEFINLQESNIYQGYYKETINTRVIRTCHKDILSLAKLFLVRINFSYYNLKLKSFNIIKKDTVQVLVDEYFVYFKILKSDENTTRKRFSI